MTIHEAISIRRCAVTQAMASRISQSDLAGIWLCGGIFQNKVGAGPAIGVVSERNTAGVSIMRLRTGDTFACPTFGLKLQLDVYAAHAHGRKEVSLFLKEGQSGCVKDRPAARQPLFQMERFVVRRH